MKVIHFLKPYRMAMAVAWLFMLTELAVELFNPLFMAKIIDDGVMTGDLDLVLKWGAIMVAMSLFAFLSGIANSFFAAHTSQGFGYDLRGALYEKVQSFSKSSFQNLPASSLITRMTNDVRQIQNTIFMSLRIMLRAPLLVVGSTIMALLVNARLTMILLLVIPVLWLFLVWVLKKGWGLFGKVQIRLDRVNEVMKENLSGMRLIKAYTRGQYEESRFGEANDSLKDRTMQALRFMEIILPLLMLVMNLTLLYILWHGSERVAAGGVQVGEVVAIVTYVTRISSVFSIFSFIITSFSRAKASSGRVGEVLNTTVDINDHEGARGKVVKGKVKFKDVSFRYPGTEEYALEEITFTLQPGETMAVLGATGAGKTSMFQLIPRLYDPQSGDIEIDGQPLGRIPLDTLRTAIGYVPQEAVLFSGTIAENLLWGKEGASQEEMEQAAKDAQIHDTIERLPRGYETVLGQKGVNLSGGQKQRLSIARALIRKPAILMLDDSTSALDMKTEAKLIDALKGYECTTLIITQKVGTAIGADIILLLEDGKLIAQGNHQLLMADSPLYREIYRSQFGEGERHVETR